MHARCPCHDIILVSKADRTRNRPVCRTRSCSRRRLSAAPLLLLQLHLQDLHHHLHILILTFNRFLERVEVALDKVGFGRVVLFGLCSCLK